MKNFGIKGELEEEADGHLLFFFFFFLHGGGLAGQRKGSCTQQGSGGGHGLRGLLGHLEGGHVLGE